MEGIQNYLKKFENLKNPRVIRERLVKIILEQTKVQIGVNDVVPKARSFFLNIPPTSKSHIFRNKKALEKTFGYPIT